MKKAFIISITALIFAGITGLWSISDCADTIKGGSEGFLGVYLEEIDEDLRESLSYKGDGTFVEDVVDDTPAEKAGIEAGDIIIEYDGQKVADGDDLRRMIRKTDPGTKVKIVVFRNGKEKALKVKIGKRTERVEKTMRIRVPRDIGIHKDYHPHMVKAYAYCCDGAFLGVHLLDMSKQLMEYFKVEHGALVTHVVAESAAEKTGIKAGDVVIEFRHREVEDADDLRYLVGKRDPGDKVEIKVVRNGSEKVFQTELGEREDNCKIDCDDECIELNLNDMELKLQQLEEKLGNKIQYIKRFETGVD